MPGVLNQKAAVMGKAAINHGRQTAPPQQQSETEVERFSNSITAAVENQEETLGC